ncbi:beta strand repeat-containing protein, partial [Limosilactobacillus reuteri]|uniref:beta strand repeat-containing protein n=1 Tax=Limosilactobacillus reuteri TaxID=1598 RepID=UPI0021A91D02
MVSKNNKKLIAEKNRRNEKQRFAIRKLNVGVASVLLGITFSIYGGGQAVAHADTDTANASDQVATSNKGDNSLADKSEVTLSSATSSASQSSTSATSANGAAQSQSSANSQPAATANTPASDNAGASSAAVEASKDQSPAENQSSTSQEVQTPAQAVTQKNSSSDTSLNTTRQALNTIALRKLNSESLANHLMLFDAVSTSTSAVAASDATAEAEDSNAVNVTTAQELMNALNSGTATTINIANNINMGDIKTGENINVDITNKRNITIQSSGETKNTVDFNGYSFKMNSNDYGVTFKNITLYGRSYFGIVRNAGSYTFDNVDYTGSQLVYTEAGYNSTVNFNGTVNANSVASYVGLNGTTYKTQGGGNQQVLQFRSGTNTINFNEDSTVNLVTTNANVIENGGGTTNINVKKGTNVILEPHTQTGMEQFFSVDGIARGIASNATTNLTIDEGANLNISLKDNPDDAYHSSALYLNSGATIKNNGNLTITSDGTPYYKANGIDAPVYINGTAVINVGNTGNLTLTATNLGTYNGDLMKINGTGTVSLDPHSTFRISGDGTGALTAIDLSSGSTFTSDQPDAFTIDLSANTSNDKSLIKNGTINFSRVKTVTDGNESQPLGKIDVTYDRNGNATSYTITAQDKNTVKQVADGLTNKSLISLVKAGEDVTLSNLHLSKNNVLTGTVASSGSNNPIYVTVTVGGVSTNVPVVGNYTVYTNTNGTVTSNNVDYAAQTGSTGGNFSIDLSKLASSLTDDAQVTVTATKDFVESSRTESVAALRALNTTTLQKLVDAATEEEKKPSYYNATEEAQTAYNNAIATGKDILANPNNYDQVDVDDAVTAIQNAQKALTGQPTNKTELQDAIDQASTVESRNNYTNADANLQKAYTDAISAGQTVLSNANATQTEVDKALTTINNAKDALNGDTKKSAAKQAAKKAVAEAATAKTNAIDSSNLTDEEKAALKQEVTKAQNAADKAIDNATTNAAVTEAQTDGVTTIDDIKVPTESAVKEAAKQAVADAATA